MVSGTKKTHRENHQKTQCFFQNVTLDNVLYGGHELGAREVKVHRPRPILNYRTDFINRPTQEPIIPQPEKIVPEIDIKIQDKKTLRRHPEEFHEVINIIIKRILKKLFFENDALKLFLYLSKANEKENDSNELDIKSAPFKKILLMSNSMKIHKYKKLKKDPFSQRFNTFLAKKVMDIRNNKLKYRWTSKISCLIKMKTHLFQLFHEYETKKLCFEKAWAIHENVVTGRTQWASTFLSNVLSNFQLLEENKPPPSPTKFFWHLKKAIYHLKNQELLTSGPEMKNDRAKIKNWKLFIDRLVAFRENVRVGEMDQYQKLYDYFANMDVKRMLLSKEHNEMFPFIGIVDKKVDVLKNKEKDMKDFTKLAVVAAKAVPRFGRKK